MRRRISATNSARQSLAPAFVAPPVYLLAAGPFPRRASLPVESTSGKCGSAAAVKSAESIVEASSARRTSMSRAPPLPSRSISSATVFSKNELAMPLAPSLPISSLSQRMQAQVRAGGVFARAMSTRALRPA